MRIFANGMGRNFNSAWDKQKGVRTPASIRGEKIVILLGKKELNNPKKLRERKAYVQSLLDEGFVQCSPSSQEWTSPERQAGVSQMYHDEIAEINRQLRKLSRKR